MWQLAAHRSIRVELLEVVSKWNTTQLDSRDRARLRGLLVFCIVGNWVCQSRSWDRGAPANRAVKMNVLVWVDGLLLH